MTDDAENSLGQSLRRIVAENQKHRAEASEKLSQVIQDVFNDSEAAEPDRRPDGTVREDGIVDGGDSEPITGAAPAASE